MIGNLQRFKKFTLSHTWDTTWYIETMALSPDGTILAYSEFDDWTFDDSGVSVYDLKTGRSICYFDTGDGLSYVCPIAISPNKRNIFWNTGYEIVVGDIITKKEIHVFQDSAGSITVSPDGQTLVCFSPEIAKMFDVETGQTISIITSPSEAEKFIATSSDGEIIISQLNNTIALYNLRSRQQISRLTITLRDLKTGKELRSFKALTKPFKALTLTPDKQTLITINSNDTITHWNANTGKEINTFEWRWHSVRAISSDSSVMVTSGKNGIIIWDLSSGKKLHVLPKDEVHSLVISANNQTIAYIKPRGGYGGYFVKVWQAL
ncbi:WD40 repeat domain-containing protein [Chroococcidiopsis sp. CCNUC1]|uniref:WD40 repeat domain-containing protein n=1 Tax=Chroococcidiopsis sp. CCNUC1 TaxID=2653189 RepID=UPI0020203ABA|nr:hypothetical protein [Chroococcidiopsis sp. CCNUC1]URD47646.1 hypothetical protein M5J74_15020 [Chroococcidiopsis sp. CCNUC1]